MPGFAPQVFPPDEMEQVSNKDDMKTSLRKVVKEVSVSSRGVRGPWEEPRVGLHGYVEEIPHNLPTLRGLGWAPEVLGGESRVGGGWS